MRMHITLDESDPPEFDSFASLLVALKGGAWSLTNSFLGELVPLEDQTRLFELIGEMEEILIRLRDAAPHAISDPSQSPPPPTAFRLERFALTAKMDEGQPVAQMMFFDVPTKGERRAVTVTPGTAMDVAIQLLRFVDQVGLNGLP